MPTHANLSDILRAEGATEQVTADCMALVEQELDAKSGVAAIALKVAHKAVTAFAPGYYESTVQSLVPRMLERLQPFWADFQASGAGQFGDYLAGRGEAVSEALLGVTDDMAHGSDRRAVVRAYNAVRDGAGRHIEAALPAVGALTEKYAS